MKQLTKQQQKVYDYIRKRPGCTTKDIMLNTGIQCPSGRITELRQAGVLIVSVGQRKYPGAHPFECYAIKEPDPPREITNEPRAETLAMNL